MEYQEVRMSMGRAITRGDLFERFYEIFLESHPKIKGMFDSTDMSVQKGLLRQGVNLALMFAEGHAIGESAMGRLRNSHSKGNLNVDPAMYRYWLDSFMKAVAELDPEFNPKLDREWRQALGNAIDHIAGGYHGQESKSA